MNVESNFLQQIIAQAKGDLPNESCGYVFGPDCETAAVNYPMTNIDHSPEHFSFDPREQFAAVKEARCKGLKVVGNWHSHPTSPSRPSEEDIRLAFDPTITYFILSLTGAEPVLNAFHIENGAVEKLNINIIQA